MAILYESKIPDVHTLCVYDPQPQICQWQGREALRLSGQEACMVVIPDIVLTQGCIEVDIGSEGSAYPGIAFRIHDLLNYELVYAQPHTSGQWDALQYDPVFHGSNTWQLYYGEGAQKQADVPVGSWHRMRLAFKDDRALLQVDEQPPLIVNALVHTHQTGLVGLWTYLPAYFSNLRISDEVPDTLLSAEIKNKVQPVQGTITRWFLEGYGVVETEPTGILNLNRYLPVSVDEARLQLRIDMPADGRLVLDVGFSDILTLQLDDTTLFEGENLFHISPQWDERGYVSMNQQIGCDLKKGIHTLTATLQRTEYFGFGIMMAIEGENFAVLPVELTR